MTIDIRLLAMLSLLTAFAACDKKEAAAGSDPNASKPAAAAPAAAPAPAAPAAGGSSKCNDAAEHKAKIKKPGVDPSTLGSVEFDKQDCESGKWSAGKADCILAANDVAAIDKCQ
jgi:hypothetical protein